MSSEKFCLKWNDFETNISAAFRDLREEKDFFDVTLACEDNQIEAHKVILSACSTFFRNILKRNPHQKMWVATGYFLSSAHGIPIVLLLWA